MLNDYNNTYYYLVSFDSFSFLFAILTSLIELIL